MANTRDYKFDISSTTSVLQGVPRDIRTSILATATRSALLPIKAKAKLLAQRSVRTGALRDSITDKIVKYERSATVVGLVGPARGYYRGGKKLGKDASRRGADSPSHYAHLVELGHHVVVRRKAKTPKLYKYTTKQRTDLARQGEAANTGDTRVAMSFVPARPFLRPAGLTTKGEQSERFFRGLDRGIEASRNRLIKAGAHKR